VGTLLVSGHNENPECLPSILLRMLSLIVRGEIRLHLPLEARLAKIRARDWHGAAIDLDHEAPARPVRK
jgi:hypothetical protein